jgi:hypothetical protein
MDANTLLFFKLMTACLCVILSAYFIAIFLKDAGKPPSSGT